MSQTSPNTIKELQSNLPVFDNQMLPMQSQECTRFDSSNPLTYADGRKILADDLVLHIRFKEGRGISAEFAKVWTPLYFDDGKPIGVSLNTVKSQSSPTIQMFSITAEDGTHKRYFKTATTIEPHEIPKRLYPLLPSGHTSNDLSDGWFAAQVTKLSNNGVGIASFARALWATQNHEFEQNAQMLIQASQQGYAHAFVQLSWLYAIGRGLAKDPYQALDCVRKGAQLGDAIAQYELAEYYLKGQCYDDAGLEKDETKAREWLKKSSEQGYHQAYLLCPRFI